MLFTLNTCLIWVATLISEIIVSIHRLDESKGYDLTHSEEVNIFITHTVIMFFIQCVILFYIFIFLRSKQHKKSVITCNLAAHFFLFLWFVYSVYQFTINGY